MDFLPYFDSSKSNTAHYALLLPWVLLLIPKLSQIQSRYGMNGCHQSKWWLFLRQCRAMVWSGLLCSSTFPLLFRESSLLLVTFVSLKEVLPNVTSVITQNPFYCEIAELSTTKKGAVNRSSVLWGTWQKWQRTVAHKWTQEPGGTSPDDCTWIYRCGFLLSMLSLYSVHSFSCMIYWRLSPTWGV